MVKATSCQVGALRSRVEGAASRRPSYTTRVISPLTPADDFARHLGFVDLETVATALAAERSAMLCSAVVDGLAELRRDLGDSRVEALLRELTLFVRRNLRGSDALSMTSDELVILLDAPGSMAYTVADRLLAAVRAHIFAAGTSDRSLRVTISLGVAMAPKQGLRFADLIRAARTARVQAGSDGIGVSDALRPPTLDLTRFVGRSEQLASFADYLDDMVRGVGHVVAVIGESGVGTSALVRTLEPEIRLRGGSLVVGSSVAHSLPAPYALWSEVLRAVRRLPVKSTRVWRELPSLERTVEGSLEDASRGGSKTRLLEELADFLRLAAQQRPLVLLLENLQWADAASWDAMEYLISQLESERILLALTFNASGGDDDALERWERLAGRPRHHAMPLTRLTRDDVKRWMEGAMRSGEPARELLAYLYRHTEGNPLLLTQLLRDLQESGHVRQRRHGWSSAPVADLPAQVDLDTLVARRLNRLGSAPRALIDTASVLGRGATASLSVTMAGFDASDGHAALQQLLDAGLVVSSYDRENTTYVVAHEEIARIARAALAPARLAELHAQVARTLAAARGSAAAEIAEHLELAGDNAAAHQYALRAADEALAVHETAAVAELLSAAERTAPSPGALADVRVRMAALAEMAGRFPEAESLCDEALVWFESQGDAVQTLRLKRTRTNVRIQRGQAARETLDNLLTLEQDAAAVGADTERTAILLLISQTHWRLGDQRAAQRVATECVEIAERGGDPLLIADACNRLAVTLLMENAARARELYDRALEISVAVGDVVRRVRSLNNIGVLELIGSNWEEARRVLTSAAEQARAAGLMPAWGRAELNLGVLAGRIGDYEGAARALSEGLRLTAIAQNSEEQVYATYNMAHLERERERFREAVDLYELVIELAERIGQVEVLAGASAGM
ncbi:MAG: diguanylate cyclase [Gemmatimonadetes bacterium]|nr:diguanylate cyclase [Gemmatimonadota bacterium]